MQYSFRHHISLARRKIYNSVLEIDKQAPRHNIKEFVVISVFGLNRFAVSGNATSEE